MRIILTLVVVSFCLLCGVLVVDSGLFEPGPAQQRCILLSNTNADEKSQGSTAPTEENAD